MREEEGEERGEERSRKKKGRKRRRWEEDEGIEPAAVFFLFGG
ncbi:MAG: hypothetical protein QIT33_gp31 [Methanophagales virus PBV300]|uniref:Uncharacterized protein n=1 Tax=Methanophagales virus PBV300 TaxID=2987731 RepID=A0ABY6GM47_9VIRU|nr:MAG: hypothetical protein QIT33_gp31 [Methanophagales virus PBV300]UYL64993.1 MAG: hypothetical protein JBCDKDKM_00031 [Methanophagales virus PBV300]